MPTFKSDIATIQDSPAPAALMARETELPYTRTIAIVYDAGGTEVADDIIQLYKLKPGMKVISVNSWVVSNTTNTDLTMNIGDSDTDPDADRYATLLNVAAAGRDQFDESPNHTIESECWLQAELKGIAGTVSASSTFVFFVTISMPF